MGTRAARGASLAVNASESIRAAAREMLLKIMEINHINMEDIISVLFTCTADLDAAYPAAAARELGLTNAALMCMQEMNVPDSLRNCVRVMVTFETELKQADIKHAYINGAEVLRPDIT